MAMTVKLYLAFLALLALERLGELALSRRNAARAFARGGVEVGQRHFRVMSIFHTAFLIACAVEPVAFARPFPGALGVACLGGAVAAQALRYWAIASLGDRWNVRVIVVPGDPPVTRGPYRFLRHPNYLAVVAEIALVPLIHGAYLTAILFSLGNAALLWVRIRAEEQALGEAYAKAFEGRSRFIPGLPRSPAETEAR
jgi:methyltransferase